MEENLFAFQKKAQAPTGSGKTIIMTALIESVLYGAEAGEYDLEMSGYMPQPDAIFVWLSDSPSLNAQSRDKIVFKSGKIGLSQCVEIHEESFDQE